MKTAIAFLAGMAFGFGLLVSGMTSPDRVLSFLDLAGAWDPALAFVMGGAVLTATPLFLLARRRARPVAGVAYDDPDRLTIDRKLVIGAVLFGLGWGLAGICPGPAVIDLVLAPERTAVFVIAMVGGITLSARVRSRFPAVDAPVRVGRITE
ncbi:MAG: DUF6691 family protein [Novosphingobium sp.]